MGFYADAAPVRGSLRGPAAWCAVARTLLPYELAPAVVACEVMQVYDQRWWKGDPADVLEVQGVAAAVCMLYPAAKVVGYLPRTWKGQVPTEIMHNRIVRRVAQLGYPDDVWCWPKAQRRRPDVSHGVGVGLYHLGLL